MLTYDEARNQIADGDIIFFKGTSLISRLVCFATASQYSHCAIAFWITVNDEKRLMVAEAQGGTRRRIVNLSFYENEQFDVVRIPTPWTKYYKRALLKLGKEQYNMFEALYVGLREFLLRTINIKLPMKTFRGEICSEYIANLLDLTPSEVSPQALFKAFNLPIIIQSK